MDLETVKKQIEEYPNKRNLEIFLSWSNRDAFKITSALYSSDIYVMIGSNVNDLQDIYNIIIHNYQLDPQLFHYPYFITITFGTYDEKTINIINSINPSIPVLLVLEQLLDRDEINLLSKITHPNCVCYSSCWINLDGYRFITERFKVDDSSDPVLVIDKIDDLVIETVEKYCQHFRNPRFRIELKDGKSLRHLYDIIPYIPENEIFIEIDNQLFDEKNPDNARNFIVEEYNENSIVGKKMIILFQGIQFESLQQIFEIEKNIQQIKSHIPFNASELDKVTYVSLFIINYFTYDEDLRITPMNQKDFKDISLAQFISRGKGVCRHFASFTKYLLNSLNVDCEVISADGNLAMNPNAEGHDFNVVGIDGKYYLLDNTWLAGRMQVGAIRTLSESTDFLRSKETFEHNDYEDAIYEECETFDREEINQSVNRVLNWNKNYQIHLSALKDLFRKHILKQQKEMTVEEKIEASIPRR